MFKKAINMNLINKNQYVLALNKRNFKFKIDFLQPSCLLPQNLFNNFIHTQTQAKMLLDNQIKEFKLINGMLNMSRKFLTSVPPNKETAKTHELNIINHNEGKIFNHAR